ncbi:response regulator [Ascidiimonas sp. W6]|uniref:response regulator n=1 Tax=Ascidiimonas meishanensis TaxID=3128903 RepID=UPI0030EC88EB
MALNILFIEDDVIEVMKLHRTIAKLGLKHNIIEAGNGEDALEILQDNDVIPDIILLDLNMPKMNGIEFLRILKENKVFKYIPSIILTTSSNRQDLQECYEIGIAGYMLKPLKYEHYIEKLKTILDYWDSNELIKA